MATRYGVNCVAVTPGGPVMATIQDTAFTQCHELVIMETYSGTGDPVAVSGSNPLPTQFVSAQQVLGNTPAGAADSGNGIKISGVYNSSPPTLASGWRGDAQLDAFGNLKVNIAAGGGAGGTSSTLGAALPTLATAVGAQSASGSLMQPLNLDGSGNLKVNVAAGSLQAVTDNSSAFSSGSTQAIPIAGAYNDSASAVTSGFMGVFRITANRQIRVVQDASTNGGLTKYGLVQPATPAATAIKTSAGQLGFLHASNDTSSPVYVKWFDLAAGSVTLGTTAATCQTEIPGNTGGSGFTVSIPQGLSFATAITYAVTGAIALNDNTSISASKVNLLIGYA
jgi:hypothetical protein